MANPVQNQQRQLAPPQVPQVNPPAPGGVGDAPTTIQPAQEEYKPGYIETFIYGIRDAVLWVLKKVFPCWFPEPPEPTPPPLPEPPPAIQPPALRQEIQAEVGLLEALERLTDCQKERVYRQIGKDMSQNWYFWPGQWFRSHEEIGRMEVRKNPNILARYLIFQPAAPDQDLVV